MLSGAAWVRIRAWLWRYGPAELLGSAAALLGAILRASADDAASARNGGGR